MTYNIGDRVRIVSQRIGPRWNEEGLMDEWLGTIMTVVNIDANEVCYKMAEDQGNPNRHSGWYWYPEMIEGLATTFESDTSDYPDMAAEFELLYGVQK